jgi:hypothetical protein
VTIKIRNAGYFASGYDVMTMPVDVTDNEGALCTRCSIGNRVNTCTVYGADKWDMCTDLTVDCCAHCVQNVIRTVLHTELPVTVEMTFDAFMITYLKPGSVEGFVSYAGPLPAAICDDAAGGDDVADPLLTLLNGDPWRPDNGLMAHPDDMRDHPEGA